MPGREHFLNVGGDPDVPFQRAVKDRPEYLLISCQHHYRLDGHGIIDIVHRIPICFTNDRWRLRNDAACQKGGNVELLPGGEIVTDNDRDFGVEHV